MMALSSPLRLPQLATTLHTINLGTTSYHPLEHLEHLEHTDLKEL